MAIWTIGKLAAEAGISVDATRYYERCKLLSECDRSPSGYRLYHDDVLHRIHFIRRAQSVGFSLNEIRELLSLHDDPARDATEVKNLVREKITDVDSRIHALERVRDDLMGLDESCPGHGSTESCPILCALAVMDEGERPQSPRPMPRIGELGSVG